MSRNMGRSFLSPKLRLRKLPRGNVRARESDTLCIVPEGALRKFVYLSLPVLLAV